jgi:hypothetical protein
MLAPTVADRDCARRGGGTSGEFPLTRAGDHDAWASMITVVEGLTKSTVQATGGSPSGGRRFPMERVAETRVGRSARTFAVLNARPAGVPRRVA